MLTPAGVRNGNSSNQFEACSVHKSFSQLKFFRALALVSSTIFISNNALAGSLLDCLTPNGDGLGYNQGDWTSMTSLLNTANGGALTTVSDLSNLNQMLSYNGLWLDVRQPQTGALTTTETANLQAYIATGRMVVLIGGPGPNSADSGYSSWDNSILAAVGAPMGVTFLDNSATPAYAISPLTTNVRTISVTSAAAASAGTTLFAQNVATIWGPARNALVFLDDTTISEFFIDNDDDSAFAQNMATWVSGASTDKAGQWQSATGGSWQTSSNWLLSQQPNIGDDVSFNLSSGGYTVTVPAALTARNLIVRHDKLTLDLSGVSANLKVAQGISVGQSASGVMSLTHSSGGGPATVAAASLTIGANSGTGSLSVGAGVQLQISGAATVASGSSLTIAGGIVTAGTISSSGSILIAAGGQLDISPAISPGTLSTIGTNSIIGKLDLSNTDLDVHNGDISAVTNYIVSGYNRGGWTGNGIISSAASGDSTHLTTLGVILNGTTYGTATGSLGKFDGTIPAPGDVLVKYTYYGDANLDGQVDGSDYTKIDNGFHNTLTGWANGDFNYDGVIDGSDYTLIDNAFNTQASPIVAASTAQVAAVPEPSTELMVPIAIFGWLGLRRRALGCGFNAGGA